MKKHLLFTYFVFLFSLLIIACGTKPNEPWVGTWQMVAYDNTSVAESDTMVLMILNEDKSIEYITQTKNGTVLMKNKGNYELNDQHSVLSVYENNELMVEYFLRKVDDDSLIFQSDTFSIKWKRID